MSGGTIRTSHQRAPMSGLDTIAEARDSAVIIRIGLFIEHGGGRASNTAPTMYRAFFQGRNPRCAVLMVGISHYL
jgi:hypothetical protein